MYIYNMYIYIYIYMYIYIYIYKAQLDCSSHAGRSSQKTQVL